MAIAPQYEDAIKTSEGPQDAGWDYNQFSGPYGVRREPDEVLSDDQALDRFHGDLGKANGVVKSLGVPMTKGQEAALTSLTYNAGTKWLNSGLGQAVRNGDWQNARNLFLQYNKAGGETNPGLVRRRAQEATWFDTPDDDGSPNVTADNSFDLHAPKAQPQAPSDDAVDTLAQPQRSTPPSPSLTGAPAPSMPLEELAQIDTENPAAPLVNKAAGMLQQAKDTDPVSAMPNTLNDADAQQRVLQALMMARAATPGKAKVSKSIVPDLFPEDELAMMGKTHGKSRSQFADGGIANDDEANNDNSSPPQNLNFEDLLAKNPKGWGASLPASPYQGEIRAREGGEGEDGGGEGSHYITGDPSWPAQMAYNISGIPELMEGIKSARESSLAGEPGGVAQSIGKLGLGALLFGRTFASRAIPEVTDILSAQHNISHPEDIEEIMSLVNRLRGRRAAESALESGARTPEQPLPRPDFSAFTRHNSGLVPHMADGGSIDRQSDNIEDRRGESPWNPLAMLRGSYDDFMSLPSGVSKIYNEQIRPALSHDEITGQMQQMGSMLPATQGHPYSGPAYTMPDTNPDNAGFTKLQDRLNAAVSSWQGRLPTMPSPTPGYADGGSIGHRLWNWMQGTPGDTSQAGLNGPYAKNPETVGDDGLHSLNPQQYRLNKDLPSIPQASVPGMYVTNPETGYARGGEVEDVQHLAMGGPAWYAKNEARGMTHSGPLLSAVPGRTDRLPATVKAGSFVVPADVVSGLGQGNTLAGNNILGAMSKNPFGLPALHGSSGYKAPKMPSVSTSKTVTKTKVPTFYEGGSTDADGEGNVPVILAGGEYVYSPDEVARFGNGDLNTGHEVLKKFVIDTRANHIKTLSSLPGPKD
jgi:lysozyme